MSDSSQLHKVAPKEQMMLNVLTEQVQLQRMSYTRTEFYQSMRKRHWQNCLY